MKEKDLKNLEASYLLHLKNKESHKIKPEIHVYASWDEFTQENGPVAFCPRCGFSLDEEEFEGQFCHTCGWGKKGHNGKLLFIEDIFISLEQLNNMLDAIGYRPDKVSPDGFYKITRNFFATKQYSISWNNLVKKDFATMQIKLDEVVYQITDKGLAIIEVAINVSIIK